MSLSTPMVTSRLVSIKKPACGGIRQTLLPPPSVQRELPTSAAGAGGPPAPPAFFFPIFHVARGPHVTPLPDPRLPRLSLIKILPTPGMYPPPTHADNA